ncbi:MAG: type I-A CRISPR-associated protein Cas5 [Candidatus Freyarchaeota archaeon]|nr:type I-A CRISPR-associated protein Cas5 [Candidatus Jordarchaeia archaeon]
MLALTVRARYHWGFWVRTPGTSKFQGALPIPPPTTILGALTYPLAKMGVLSLRGVRQEGDVVFDSKKGIMSPAGILEDHVYAVARFDPVNSFGYVWDDLSKCVTLLFQETTKSTDEEKAVGGRRYIMKYRTGALPVGKVYYPSGRISMVLLVKESAREIVAGSLEDELRKAAWQMTRVGSKESIVSVEEVLVSKANPLDDRVVRTRYYFPARLGSVEEGDYYREAFWSGGWGRGVALRREEYIVPGSKIPLMSGEVKVSLLSGGRAFEANGEVVVGYE